MKSPRNARRQQDDDRTDRLSPLAVVVGLALAAVLAAGTRVADFAESAMDDRDALLARYRWAADQREREAVETRDDDPDVDAA